MIHFDLIFMGWGVRPVSRFTLLHVDVQSFMKPFVERLPLLHYIPLLLHQRLLDCVCVSPFLGSLSVPFIYLSIFSLVSYCLNYHSFIVNFEVG